MDRVGAPRDLSTVVLIQGDTYYTQSSAALRTIALLDWPFRAMAVLWIVPYPLRDLGYAVVARLRYRVFGQMDTCRIPTKDLRSRFIDGIVESGTESAA